LRADNDRYGGALGRAPQYGYGEAAEPDPLADFIRRWWWLLGVGVVVGMVAAFAYSSFGPSSYQTSALVQVPAQQTQFDPTEKAEQARSATVNYAAEAGSPRTFELAADALPPEVGLNATELIRMKRSGDITINAVDNANFIEITVINSDPDRAQLLANTFATVIVDDVNGRSAAQSSEQRNRLENQIEFTRENLASAELFTRQQSLEEQIRDQRSTLLALQSGYQQEVERQSEYDSLQNNPGFNEPLTDVQATRQELQRIIGDQIREVEQNLTNLNSELEEVMTAIEDMPGAVDPSTSAAFASAYALELGGLTSQYVSQQVASLTATPPLVKYGEASTPLVVQGIRRLLLFGIVGGGALASIVAFATDRLRSHRQQGESQSAGIPADIDLDQLARTLERLELTRNEYSSNGVAVGATTAKDSRGPKDSSTPSSE
jgi:capsular polysaccharide biosynthesis protein